MKHKRFPGFMLILPVMVAGCVTPGSKAGNRNNTDTSGGSRIRRMRPAELVDLALRRRIALTSMKAEAYMRILDRPNEFSLRINTEILAQRPDRLRIHASKAMGKIEVFDTIMAGDEIAFFVPRRRTLYQGRLADLAHARINFNPADVLRQLLWRNSGLELKTWVYAANRDRANLVLDEKTAPGKPRLRLHISRDRQNLVRITRLNSSGRTILRTAYSKFRIPATRPARGKKIILQNGARFPYHIELEWPMEKRSVTIDFKSVIAEAVIADELWFLDVPERTRTKPIRKIKVQGDKKKLKVKN